MGERICSEVGCGGRHYGRGWCGKHYARWLRAGGVDPAPVAQREKSAWERFWEKVDADGDCWLWIGAINRSGGHAGYGVAWDVDKRRTVGAHRLAWKMLVGEPPSALDLDHLCRNRACVNPDHLELVTHQENVRRGQSGWNTRAKTHCPRGHAYEGDNLRIYRGRRFCITCARTRGERTKAHDAGTRLAVEDPIVLAL